MMNSPAFSPSIARQSIHLFIVFFFVIGFSRLDANDLDSRPRFNGVNYTIAETAPINEQAWINLEAKNLLDVAVADFFTTLAQQPFDLSPEILESLKSLEKSDVKLTPWMRARVSARITLTMASRLIDAEVDQDQAKITTVLESAAPVLNQFALAPLASKPGSEWDFNYLDPDIKRQVLADWAAVRESDDLELDLVGLRSSLYKLLKPTSNPEVILNSAKIPTPVRDMLKKDLAADSSNTLGNLLMESRRQRLRERPVKTDYISNNPGFQLGTKMHP